MLPRVLLIAAAALTGCATGGVGDTDPVESVGLGGRSTPVLSDGSIAALERPSSSTDPLPADVLELSFARQFADRNAARLVSRDTERSVYLVPGTHGTICLVVTEATGTGVNCVARSVLHGGAVWQGTGAADGTTDIVGVVGDGVAYATANGKTRVPVRGNAFTINGVKDRTLILGTENGVEVAFDLGDLTPPE